MANTLIRDWRGMPDGREKYSLYLASREWAVLKEQVRARSGGTCERCRNAPGEQVHHQTYERKYREEIGDLIHVCRPCHEFISGKTNYDPRSDAPAWWAGLPIRRVYLAGKITGDPWRDEIAPGWSDADSSLLSHCLSISPDFDRPLWWTQDRALPVASGHRLDLTGPFWRPLGCCGHGDPGDRIDLNSCGSHAQGEWRGKVHERAAYTDAVRVFEQVERSIAVSDLVFAWIDREDVFGTLVELGIARGVAVPIVVAMPLGFRDAETWMATATARQVIRAETPGDAWRLLWSNPISSTYGYELEIEHDDCDDKTTDYREHHDHSVDAPDFTRDF